MGYLPAHAFTGLPHLAKLELEECGLTSFAPSAFKGLDNLKELSLSGNFLSEIPVDALADVSNLARLYLSSNKLGDTSTLPANLPSILPKLKSIRLNDNGLTGNHLSSRIFAFETNTFISIKLSQNRFDRFPTASISSLNAVLDINLRQCDITMVVKSDFEVGWRFQALDLSFNHITHLEVDVFDDLSRLVKLSIESNHFRRLSSNPIRLLARLSNLRTLDIGGYNELEEPPTLFPPSLVKLVMPNYTGCNPKSRINGSMFEGLNNLEELDLRLNRYREGIPERLLSPLWNIRTLFISGMELTSLARNTFAAQTHLKTLDLSYNYLTRLSIS